MLDAATLRALVREVIAEEVAAVKAAAKAGTPAPVSAAAPPDHQARIAGDADLRAFARQVLALASDPARRQAIEAGTYPFRLQAPAAAARPAASAASARVEAGVVTETMIGRLAKGTVRLELAPGVSITPLARDAARRLNIAIERTRS